MRLRRSLVWISTGFLVVAVVGCDPRALPLPDDAHTRGQTGGFPGTGGGAAGAPGGGAGGMAGGGVGGMAGGGIGGNPGGAGGAGGAIGACGPTAPLPAGVTPQPYVPETKIAGDCATASTGTAIAAASAAEVASLLVGRWQLCTAGQPSANPSGAGIEFACDRRWRRLDLVAGALVPGTGANSEGVWYVTAEDPHDMLTSLKSVVRLVPVPAVNILSWGYPIDFIQSPTRLHFAGGAIYVWRGQ